MGSVGTRLITALATSARTSEPFTESGENQIVNRNGDTTVNVVADIPYQTAQQLNVILTEKTRVVMEA